MDCTIEKLHFLIETLRRSGFNGTQIHEIMETSWPDNCLSLRRVQTISKEFADGERVEFDDGRKMGSGRKKSESRLQHIELVRNLTDENKSTTVQHIADTLNISHTMTQRILTEDLDKQWVHTKWVPHTLSEINKAIRIERCTDLLEVLHGRLARKNLVTIDEKFFYLRNLNPKNTIGCWVTPGGDETVVQTARRSPMERKYMAIIAVSQMGFHYYELLAKNESIDAERYIQFLANLEGFLKNIQHPILAENLRLLQDNARPHVARATIEYITSRNIRLLKQPPYSPDCNLCDRYIFNRLEAQRKNSFENKEAITAFLDEQLPLFSARRMEAALVEMERHMTQIVANGGNYVSVI